MTLSLCAASHTALSVSSNPGTTLVWRTIVSVEPGEAVVDMGDDVLGRGVVPKLTVGVGKSSSEGIGSVHLVHLVEPVWFGWFWFLL